MRRMIRTICILSAASLVAGAPVAAANFEDDPDRSTGSMEDAAGGSDANVDRDVDRDVDSDPMNAMNASAGEGEYTVKKGDTLADIAKQELGNADEWKQIASANGIDDPKELRVGQKLKIPAKGAMH